MSLLIHKINKGDLSARGRGAPQSLGATVQEASRDRSGDWPLLSDRQAGSGRPVFQLGRFTGLGWRALNLSPGNPGAA